MTDQEISDHAFACVAAIMAGKSPPPWPPHAPKLVSREAVADGAHRYFRGLAGRLDTVPEEITGALKAQEVIRREIDLMMEGMVRKIIALAAGVPK